MTESPVELLERARRSHAVVVGGGIAGLVAALECAKIGMRVTLVEASPRVGGVLRTADVGGVPLDVGAESFATRGGHVKALIDQLGLGDDVVAPIGGRAWVAGLPGPGEAAAPLPEGGVLGIPDNPFAPDVVRVIGRRAAWRAYTDRLRPVLTIGQERSLGRLVRTRMGEVVLDRLVAPVASGVYSAHPDDIDVELAAPGLNNALTSAGSLMGAVAALRDRRTAAPGSAVLGIAGGMTRLADALADRIIALGVDVQLGVAVDRITRLAGTDEWIVGVGDAELRAQSVIVATPEPAARALLAPAVPDLGASEQEAPTVELLTLLVEAPLLDVAPRGSGVLTVPGSHRAKALTHSSAKWEWVARAVAPHHVVRVSFGTQGEPPATAGLDDADAAALAVAEASALLGVPSEALTLRSAHRAVYAQSQPASAIGQADRAARARAAIREVPGLAAVGAWLSGTGLAQVVPDAIAETELVRHRVLWSEA